MPTLKPVLHSTFGWARSTMLSFKMTNFRVTYSVIRVLKLRCEMEWNLETQTISRIGTMPLHLHALPNSTNFATGKGRAVSLSKCSTARFGKANELLMNDAYILLAERSKASLQHLTQRSHERRSWTAWTIQVAAPLLAIRYFHARHSLNLPFMVLMHVQLEIVLFVSHIKVVNQDRCPKTIHPT